MASVVAAAVVARHPEPCRRRNHASTSPAAPSPRRQPSKKRRSLNSNDVSTAASSLHGDGTTTLVEEAGSEFGTLQVFKVADDHRDASFRGATVLMRAHTPDAVLSEYRGDAPCTGGVFDLFATLPPLLADVDPTNANPIAILGLGAGTCARSLAALYPTDTRLMVGWELDPSIVYLARRHFGMEDLEQSGRLKVRCGDAFEGIRRAGVGLYKLNSADL
jgi:hypothetical protein